MSAEDRKRRKSHVLDLLQKQKEEHEAENPESGGDTPFPDLYSELGLDGSTGDGEK